PHGAIVDVRGVVEAEGGVPGAELLRALEEADDLAVLGVGGHAVPGPRGELRRAGLEQGMDPLRDDAVRFRHLGDLRQYLSLRVGLASRAATPRLQLLCSPVSMGPTLAAPGWPRFLIPDRF